MLEEFFSKNQIINIETNLVILLLKIMILVMGGVYLLGGIYFLGNYENYRNIKKTKCESDFYAQIARSKYGSDDSRYKNAIKKCIKEGNFLIP